MREGQISKQKVQAEVSGNVDVAFPKTAVYLRYTSERGLDENFTLTLFRQLAECGVRVHSRHHESDGASRKRCNNSAPQGKKKLNYPEGLAGNSKVPELE